MADSTRRTISLFTLLYLLSSLSSSSAQCFSSKAPGEEGDDLTKALSPEGNKFQKSNSGRQLEFTLNMFHKLYKKDEKSNLFFSPHSIHQALMLAFFGSVGNTETELRKALHLPDDSKESIINSYKMENYYQEARQSRLLGKPSYQLKIANRIFFSKDEPIRTCVTEIFEKELEFLDFANETEPSRLKINHWVEKSTNGKIKDIIPPGIITSETRLALANSAYFKGNWEQQFKKSNTKLSLFYTSPKEFTQTMMMHQKGSFRHGASEALGSYIIELPYEGQSLSMFILLPPFTGNALEETISRLTPQTLKEAIDQMYEDSIEVFLPKFKIEQTMDLVKSLHSIGITDLFNPATANLTDFSTGENLAFGTARHQSFLEVNEEGSEAASATVLIDTRSGRPLDQTRFVCNHPFVFFIHDNALNNILFMGAFRSPKHLEKSYEKPSKPTIR